MVKYANAIQLLSQTLPTDTIVTLGAGNYTHFVLRHHVFHCADSLLAPVCAPMGYSVPAAIAAAMEAPQREVGGGRGARTAQQLRLGAADAGAAGGDQVASHFAARILDERGLVLVEQDAIHAAAINRIESFHGDRGQAGAAAECIGA
jgi:hypothetical protein